MTKLYDGATLDDFWKLRQRIGVDLLAAPLEERVKWQQMVVKDSDLHKTHELSNVVLSISRAVGGVALAQHLVKPDLPWAEDHFAERVGGEPINPGKAHAYWPYHGASIQEHLRSMGEKGEHYDHNYMERMWCRGLEMATIEQEETVLIEDANGSVEVEKLTHPPFSGYRFEVGDLGSVIELLRVEPTTRQAFLPIWFPEDTGVTAGQRVPCTIGYHFILRERKYLDMTYFLRACEWYRHFHNDVYLAVRLLQWVCNEVGLIPGSFTMHVSNMHLFKGDEHRV